MIRKPTSGDSEQREREAKRARRHSEISPSGSGQLSSSGESNTNENGGARKPAHGGSEGESAHGAIPRRGIDYEKND